MTSAVAYLDTKAAAEFLGVAVVTLARWRMNKQGPPFIKAAGMRNVRYPLADLVGWLERGKVKPGSCVIAE